MRQTATTAFLIRLNRCDPTCASSHPSEYILYWSRLINIIVIIIIILWYERWLSPVWNNEDMRSQQLQTDRGANIELIPCQCQCIVFCTILYTSYTLYTVLHSGTAVVHCTTHWKLCYTPAHIQTDRGANIELIPCQCQCIVYCTALYTLYTLYCTRRK